MKRDYDIVKFVLFLLIGLALVITGIILCTKQQEQGSLYIVVGVNTFVAGCTIFLPFSKK